MAARQLTAKDLPRASPYSGLFRAHLTLWQAFKGLLGSGTRLGSTLVSELNLE